MLRLDPNLVMDISLVENDVNGTIDVIWERSKLHHDHLQPAVEMVQRSGKENITTKEIDEILGLRISTELKMSTSYMIEGVNRGISSTKNIVHGLRDAGKEKYPNEKFVCIT